MSLWFWRVWSNIKSTLWELIQLSTFCCAGHIPACQSWTPEHQLSTAAAAVRCQRNRYTINNRRYSGAKPSSVFMKCCTEKQTAKCFWLGTGVETGVSVTDQRDTPWSQQTKPNPSLTKLPGCLWWTCWWSPHPFKYELWICQMWVW